MIQTCRGPFTSLCNSSQRSSNTVWSMPVSTHNVGTVKGCILNFPPRICSYWLSGRDGSDNNWLEFKTYGPSAPSRPSTASWPRAKHFPVRPDLSQSMSIHVNPRGSTYVSFHSCFLWNCVSGAERVIWSKVIIVILYFSVSPSGCFNKLWGLILPFLFCVFRRVVASERRTRRTRSIQRERRTLQINHASSAGYVCRPLLLFL